MSWSTARAPVVILNWFPDIHTCYCLSLDVYKTANNRWLLLPLSSPRLLHSTGEHKWTTLAAEKSQLPETAYALSVSGENGACYWLMRLVIMNYPCSSTRLLVLHWCLLTLHCGDWCHDFDATKLFGRTTGRTEPWWTALSMLCHASLVFSLEGIAPEGSKELHIVAR